MAVQDNDLMVVQRSGVAYKTDTQTLKTYFQNGVSVGVATAARAGTVKPGANLTVAADGTLNAAITGALSYKGTKDFTGAQPAAKAVGDLYVNTKAGTVDASWTGIAGINSVVGEMALWDGTKWDIVGLSAASGLNDISGVAPVVVTKTNPAAPVVSVANVVASTGGGTGGTAGLMTAAMAEKLNGIAAGAQTGTVTTVTASAPLHVATPTTTPALTIDNASITAHGVVQLADAAAVTAGTAGRVVDAAQLKAVSDAIATATGGGITGLTGAGAISVTPATGAVRTINVAAATTGVVGVIQLATNAEVLTGTVSTKAVTPSAAKAAYMPLDISTLTSLP